MRLAGLLVAATLVAGCVKPEDKALPPPRIEQDTVIFAPGAAQLASLHSTRVEPRKDAVVRFNGRLVWDEDRTARVFTPFAGKVQSISVRPGDRVRTGQVLAMIAAPELGAAQSEARKAEQDYALAQKTRARVEELHAGGVAPDKDLQVAQAEEGRTAAERSRTQARLRAYGATARDVDQRFALRSPVAGVVVERQLNPGQELRPDGAPPGGLFVISDPARLWFVLDVAENALGSVRPGVEVRLLPASLGGEPAIGRIEQVADQVDPQTRSVKVRGTVGNRERRLKAEMYVTAELALPAAQGLLVPANAVYLRGERYFVFVDAGGGRYLRKPVTLGPGADGHQAVLEGLQDDDKVVVDGTLLLEKILASKD